MFSLADGKDDAEVMEIVRKHGTPPPFLIFLLEAAAVTICFRPLACAPAYWS